MDEPSLTRLLDAVAGGVVTASEAAEKMTALRPARARPFTIPSSHVRVDVARQARTGMPEVIYAAGKNREQLRAVAQTLLEHGEGPVLATKAGPEAFDAVKDCAPEAEYHALARTIVLRRERGAPIGTLAVLTAGTSDVPVAEEAAVVADACGVKVERIFDVGVAGIHRLLSVRDEVRAADVVIVVAGMEGALPSVVGGMVRSPVVAVPTSVGYGASFGGLAALLSMLNSCAPGIAVVNIDNGFGAAAFAVRLLKARA
ncbi:MAG: nickel pincer cofactor biosynthesis protein LarB [Actinomycetota bacterium]